MSVAVEAPRERRLRVPAFIAHDRAGLTGAVVLTCLVLVALVGPLFAPHSTTAPIGLPGQGPSAGAPLGYDYLGRDVLSRLLSGGRSTFALGVVATALTYAIGLTVGLTAGYTQRRFVDGLLMRGVDVFLSVPALLVLLVLVSGVGSGRGVLVVGAAIVMFPGVARIVRTATLEVSTRGYVEAAVARGEAPTAVMRREILPNIMAPLMADVGVRFSWAIILIASVNFLGLGLAPPASDWGLMISENRLVLATNVWSVVAPALILAMLVIAVNLVAEAYVRQLGKSGGRS